MISKINWSASINLFYILLLGVLTFPFLFNISFHCADYWLFLDYLNSGNNMSEYLWSFTYTFVFMFITVIGQIILGMTAAYLAYFSRKNSSYIVLFFIPYTIPIFISTLAIRLSYESNGLITNILNTYLINGEYFYPLSDNLLSFALLIVLNIWQYFPFAFIIIYTIMRRTNNQYIEMAISDGASDIDIFKQIMLPNFRQIMFPLIVLRLLFMFNKYDITVLFAKSTNPSIESLKLFPLILRDLFNSINYETYGIIIVLFTMFFFIALTVLLKVSLSKILSHL